MEYDEDAGPHFGHKDLPDGRRAWLVPLLMGTCRLVVGQPGSQFLEDGW